MPSNKAVDPVNEILPPPKLFTLGLQHVLVMYAGAIAVPLTLFQLIRSLGAATP